MAKKKESRAKFVFLSHTADSKFRAFGKNLEEQFANAALAMCSLMFELEPVELKITKKISVEGKDEKALLYNWLEEFLFLMDTENFILKEVKSIKITMPKIKSKEKTAKLKLSAVVAGDTNTGQYEFLGSHVKSVTYQQMEIEERYVQVVVDT